MRSSTSLVALLALLPLVKGTAQLDQPLWTVTIDREVTFWRRATGGVLLVGTAGTLLALDEHTGKELWRRTGLPAYVGPEGQLRSVDAFGAGRTAPAAVLREVAVLWDAHDAVLTFDSGGVHARLEVLDLRTGARSWGSEGLPFADLRGYLRASPTLLLVYGTGGTPGAPERVLVGVDLDAGQVRWQRRDVFAKPPLEFEAAGSGLETSRGTIRGNQWPVLDGDTTAILFWSAEGPIKIDLRTGEPVWAAPVEAARPPAIAQDYPEMLLANGVVYAPFDHSLQAFSASDGHPVWREPIHFNGKIAQFELTPAGLLVRGAADWAPLEPLTLGGRYPAGRFIELLDPATGTSRWPRRDKPLAVMTPFVRDGDWVYGATHDTLYRIALTSGAARALAGLKFEAHGFPQGLELRNGHLLVLSPQTLMLFDTTGTPLYRAFFPPSSLFQLTLFSRDHAYIMTKHADSSGRGAGGLLKVNKDSGKPELRALLGASWGDYLLDESLELLFRLKQGREIECYPF